VEIIKLIEQIGISVDEEPKSLLTIKSESFKTMNCTKELIMFFYDSIKMLLLFEGSKLNIIIQQVEFSHKTY